MKDPSSLSTKGKTVNWSLDDLSKVKQEGSGHTDKHTHLSSSP